MALKAGTISILNPAQFDKTSTQLQDVPGLMSRLQAGATYSFNVRLRIAADIVGGIRLSLGGRCTASFIQYQINAVANTTGGLAITSVHNALNDDTKNTAVGDTFYSAEISGVIVVAGGGDLAVRFAQAVASGVSSLQSYCELEIR